MPKALIRTPGPRLAEGIVTHIDRQPVDLALAKQQWTAYVETLHSSGWGTIAVPAADDCPDAVFVEDTVVVYRDVAVITQPGAAARQPEIVDAEKVVDSLGYVVAHIRPPGTLDGGDVLKVGELVYVGCGGRTNGEGVRQLRAILEPHGATVLGVPIWQGLAPEVGRHGPAGRVDRGLSAAGRQPRLLPALSCRAGGVGLPCRPARRGPIAPGCRLPSKRGAVHRSRIHPAHRRHQRVSEARRLRDVPICPPARATGGVTTPPPS